MIFWLVGIFALALSIYFMWREDEVSFAGLLGCVCGIIFIVMGCFVPIAGYEKPVVVETKALYPIDQGGFEQSGIYLIEEMFDNDNENLATTYRYRLYEDGKLIDV